MNQRTLTQMWDMVRQHHGIGIRAIERLPEDKLDSHPIPNMRTPKELVVHLYGMAMRNLVVGSYEGRLEELDEPGTVAKIKTKAELLAYCRDCWESSNRTIASFTDEKLDAMVETPWGSPLQASRLLNATHEEYLHHRGQLYAYLRALGVEPPDLYDFKGNAPEFQPRQKQQA